MTGFRVLIAYLAGLVTGMFLGVMGAPSAKAHDGYEPVCCNNVHCKPVPVGGVKREGAFWVLPDGTKIHAGETRYSSTIGKRGFHLCRWNAGDFIPGNYEQTSIVRPKGAPVCFYVPDAEN